MTTNELANQGKHLFLEEKRYLQGKPSLESLEMERSWHRLPFQSNLRMVTSDQVTTETKR